MYSRRHGAHSCLVIRSLLTDRLAIGASVHPNGQMSGRLLLVLAPVVCALALAGAGVAATSYTDPAGDAGTAQDIVGVSVDDDAGGHLTFTVTFAAQQDF